MFPNATRMNLGKTNLIFVFSFIRPGGGAEKQVLLQAEQLCRVGFKVTFVCKEVDIGHFKKYCPSANVTTNWFRTLITKKSSLVFSFLAPDHKFCVLFAVFGCIRWIPFERIHPVFYKHYAETNCIVLAAKRLLLCLAYGFLAERILVQTQSAAFAWKALLSPFFAKKIFVVPNICPVFEHSREVTDHESVQVAAPLIRFLMSGRLIHQKDYPFALRSFAVLRKRYKLSFCLNIFGQGPRKENLLELTKELGINDLVSFRGFTNAMVCEYKKHDVFVMTSHAEGMPNTLAEAMGSGLACVVLDFEAGPRDLLGDTYSENLGQLVTERSEDSFAAVLYRFAEDGELRKRAGQANKERIAAHFSEIKFVDAFRAAIESSANLCNQDEHLVAERS